MYIKGLPDDVQNYEAFKRVLLECCPEIENEINSTAESPQPELMVNEEGKSRGFGFCLLKNHKSAKKLVDAVRSNGKTLFASRVMGRDERIRY